MKKYIVWVFACLMALSGCSTEVEVDLPAHKPMLVVNSLFSPDSLFTVKVFNSLPILSNQDHSVVENAIVVLYEEGHEVETLPFDAQKNYYRSPTFKPAAGKTYGIKVSAPGFPTATAESTIPLPVTLQNATLKDTAGIDENSNYYSEVTYTFQDQAAQTNYYSFRGFNEYPILENESDTIFSLNVLNLFSNLPIIEYSNASNLVLLKDLLFDGKNYSITLDFTDTHRITGVKIDYLFVMKTVSKDYYEYFRNLDTHLTNQDSALFSGEPVSLYGNVKNGYGIFAGYSEDMIRVKR